MARIHLLDVDVHLDSAKKAISDAKAFKDGVLATVAVAEALVALVETLLEDDLLG